MSFVARFILLACFLIHIHLLSGQFWIYFANRNSALSFSFIQGILYLLYPVCGWVADVFVSRFKIIKWSFGIILIGSLMFIVAIVLAFLFPTTAEVDTAIFFCFDTLVFLFVMVGLGMFEANAIQFSLDQMMEASSEQLSSFIHWYFWCAHAGSLVMFYFFVSVLVLFINGLFKKLTIYDLISNGRSVFLWHFFILLVFSIFFSVLNAFVFFCCKKYFQIEEIKQNPLKLIINVLKYSYHHKYPERRSAFTYWENYIPSRIDLGKEKYGGPFTYEQVEDVKTMLRLLLLMVSLFGFHITGDGHSLTHYILNTMGCPSLVPFITIIMNPQHIPLLIVTFGIPLYQFTKKYTDRYSPISLLTRMKIGLFICLLNEALLCGYALLIPQQHNDYSTVISDTKHIHSMQSNCLLLNYIVSTNGSLCDSDCQLSNSFVLYLSLIPLALKGFSYLIISLTMLEFICAQSPNAMKGILIGVWYSMLAIKYSLVNVLDILLQRIDITPWNIYHGIKGLLVFFSIIAFFKVCKHYRYRERNEVVGEQTIIEELYERELLLNSSSSSSID